MKDEILIIKLEDGNIIEMTYEFFHSKTIDELLNITNGRRVIGYDIKE